MKTITIPPSKSHTLRALVFGMLGIGTTRIKSPLPSPDTDRMIEAICQFGAKVFLSRSEILVKGGFNLSDKRINSGNSGLVYRLITGLSALFPSQTVITGDHSIRTRRPILPLLNGLKQLGAQVLNDPVTVKGPIKPGCCKISGEDSQPVSALLIASSFLKGQTEIVVENPGEKPWIDVTLHWLKKLGAHVQNENYERYFVPGHLNYLGFDYTVPADFSTAAFPIVGALITKSPLRIKGLDKHEIQGDKALIPILINMGANICWEKDLLISPTEKLIGKKIDVNRCIDALPILAVVGCFAEGQTEIRGAKIARKKESDRISAISQELKKMGADIQQLPDGLIIKKSPLRGASVDSHNDHRIALALSIAALGAFGPTEILRQDCIAKTYPNFENELDLVRI